jgi:hypothetical protein
MRGTSFLCFDASFFLIEVQISRLRIGPIHFSIESIPAVDEKLRVSSA